MNIHFVRRLLHSTASALLLLALGCRSSHPSQETKPVASTQPVAGAQSLAGEWRFALDRSDAGIGEQWFQRDLADKIKLPGALQFQGYGDEISTNTPWVAKLIDTNWFNKPKYQPYTQPGNVKVPFFLTPPRHYVGAAWYQRDIEIPEDWRGKRVVLTLERAHWETRAWVDDRLFGTNRSLGTPHEYQLGVVPEGTPSNARRSDELAPGKHRLTIRVDNRMIVDVGSDAHSVSDETQTAWNGIAGKVELSTTGQIWIEDLQVFPKFESESAVVRGRLGNATGRTTTNVVGLYLLDLYDASPPGSKPVTNISVVCPAGSTAFEVEVACGNPVVLWDEFKPGLFELAAFVLNDQRHGQDVRSALIGFRKVGTDGLHLTMNGKKFLARGTLECAIFPLTGYPPMDVESWRKIIRTCKDYGLNHIRFHSWTPPEAAFEAADELGFYLQIECGVWARAGARLGYGDPVDQWLYEETDAILKAYGNHPSFVFMAHGNEPAARPEFLATWVKYLKEKDPRRLYTSATGWGQTGEDQFHAAMAVVRRQTPNARGESGWRGRDYSAGLATARVPLITHEIGQFCAYPNFAEIAKYTGPLKPGNLEIFRDFAERGGILEQNKELAHASGRLQVLCYKEEIEAALRTTNSAGFQLLDLHDFPGQGTALIGVLDAFWESKGYVTPKEFRRFCSATVPLARLAKRTFTTAEVVEIPVEIAHFGSAPITNARPHWKLVDPNGLPKLSGMFSTPTIPLGGGTVLGKVTIDCSKLAAPSRYRLVVSDFGNAASFGGAEQNTNLWLVIGNVVGEWSVQNDWNLWVYPAETPTNVPPNVTLATELDEATLGVLQNGGRVLLFPRQIGRAHPPVSFTPIFWNNQLFPNERKQTLGLFCDPWHPALAEFPTFNHSEWNWEAIVNGARAFDCATLPRELRPVIQIIDDWNTGRKLALAFECKVGAGKLLVCGSNLPRLAEQSPAARQLQRSLLRYLGSERFNPSVALTTEQVRTLLALSTSNVGAPGSDRPLTELTPDN